MNIHESRMGAEYNDLLDMLVHHCVISIIFIVGNHKFDGSSCCIISAPDTVSWD